MKIKNLFMMILAFTLVATACEETKTPQTPDNTEDALTWDPAEFVENAETLLNMDDTWALILK